jgi:hypothetical protein
MERLNKIFAEWAKEDKKTELASEKVELGLIDDIEKDYKKAASKAMPLKKQALDVGNKLIDINGELLAIQKRAEKAAKMAKDLGANEILGKMNSLADASDGLAKGWMKSGSKILIAAKEI